MLCILWHIVVVVVVFVKVMQMFEQFEMSDAVISLVKLAIGLAEHDDPNLVRSAIALYSFT